MTGPADASGDAGFTDLVDLAAKRLGGMVLAANDEFFAPKENLLEPAPPVLAPDRFTDRGKWMDGWETRRRREPGHDWCVVRLGLPGIVRGVVVDTTHFTGNHPEACSIDGTSLEVGADPLDPTVVWTPVLPRTSLAGDTANRLAVGCPYRITHLRLAIHPDGGVARLRVHGEVVPDRLDGPTDLASVAHGGAVVDASGDFFAPRHNLVMVDGATHMGDGWETRRRRGAGHDWAEVRLAGQGVIQRVEVDTSHFKGNHPEACSLDVRRGEEGWRELLGRTPLQPHLRHRFDVEPSGPATHARLHIYPDGGVARLRLWGALDADGTLAVRLRHLNTLLPAAAERELLRCGGSSAWAGALARRRPFAGVDALLAAADEVWDGVGRDDWLESFASHPRIGERAGRGWASQEQSATATAHAGTLVALREANRAYEDRYGHRFIVFATGRSTEQMLEALRARMGNDPDAELAVAGGHQRRIAALRLRKLLGAA